MGCQKDIAAKIVDAEADDCLAVKDNQPTLRADIVEAFQSAREEPAKLAAMNYAETHDKGQGRTETRRCWTVDVADRISQADQWKNPRKLALVEAKRTVGGKTSNEQRYYISSCRDLTAIKALDTVRADSSFLLEVLNASP